MLTLRFLKIPVAATYKLIDMASATIGLMDALGIKSAHLVGASMGGMIAQAVVSAARALAHLHHVDHEQSARAAADPRSGSHADGTAAEDQGGVHQRYGQTWNVLRAGHFPEEEARPEGGKDTAASIPNPRILMIDGMGHALPMRFWGQIIGAIDKHVHGVATKAA